jgi:hypothetical protein
VGEHQLRSQRRELQGPHDGGSLEAHRHPEDGARSARRAARSFEAKRRSRDEAQRAGTAGRRGDQSKTVQLATSEDLARIATITAELGWDQARLDAFLRSGSSPLKHRASIRTLRREQSVVGAEAHPRSPEEGGGGRKTAAQHSNWLREASDVWWALKRIRDRQKKAVRGSMNSLTSRMFALVCEQGRALRAQVLLGRDRALVRRRPICAAPDGSHLPIRVRGGEFDRCFRDLIKQSLALFAVHSRSLFQGAR